MLMKELQLDEFDDPLSNLSLRSTFVKVNKYSELEEKESFEVREKLS